MGNWGDKESWDDAESFKPERFDSSAVDFTGNNIEYIPFGARRRMCPGLSFGIANVELPLAQLLYHFNWELPDGKKPQDPDMFDAFGAVLAHHFSSFFWHQPRPVNSAQQLGPNYLSDPLQTP
ncbi:hypothetical protein LguiB_001591 [Lonicera macranthoides]